MECCTVNGLDKYFDSENAQQKVEDYLSAGLEERAQHIVDFLKGQGLAGQSLLEVGCGVGGLLIELLKAGAEKGVGVDAAPAAINAAQGLAEKQGLSGKVEYQVLDFAASPNSLSTADIVVLDRVVCCYPKMRELVLPAAQHAHKFLALTYPRDLWWVRLRIMAENFFYWLSRIEFRTYLHPPAKILGAALEQGFQPVLQKVFGEWHLVIFGRQT
ncbi:MAG: methyltransferase domain-containing protein [Chloroflexi bacterium]|nr:methyltransferase domain-containing protein [Chloroflexota bacterium]